MIILDNPYVSDFLIETILKMKLPVLKNNIAQKIAWKKENILLEENLFIESLKKKNKPILYTNSENSINWITKHLEFTSLPNTIHLFKDKVKTRVLLKGIYPDFFFKEIQSDQLEDVDITKIKKPFIIKPSIGFFSMGVYKVNNDYEWGQVINELKKEIENVKGIYPAEVIDANKFIIEEHIDGEEFAVDVYYNENGKPVILNVLKHIFSSDKDVSDRVYITSNDIIEEYHPLFLKSLTQIGDLAELANFPIHIEYRVDQNNNVIPIEINPMRFAGWCTTDVAYFAYGINVYEYYFKQLEPNWKEILKDKEDKIYSIVVADLPKDIEISKIKEVDYQKFHSHFERVLELRKIDYQKHPVFAFLFAETRKENWVEIEQILKSNLKEFFKLHE